MRNGVFMIFTEHINMHTRNSKHYMEDSLTPEDWILTFFYAGPDRNERNPEIDGMLMVTKQFFVFVKEVKKDLEKEFEFVPFDYGPYSFVLKKSIDKLIKEGYIQVRKYEDRQDFILTDKGVERAKKTYEKIDGKTKKTLENLRREATQLGYSGVLRYVYSRYPEYITASKIRSKVLHEY